MNAYFVAMMFGALVSTDPPHMSRVQQADGKTVYAASCKKCHGPQGVPSQAMTKMMQTLPVLDAAFVSKLSLATVEDAVKKGKGKMKPLGDKLSAEEVSAVSKYVFELAKTKPAAAKAAH